MDVHGCPKSQFPATTYLLRKLSIPSAKCFWTQSLGFMITPFARSRKSLSHTLYLPFSITTKWLADATKMVVVAICLSSQRAAANRNDQLQPPNPSRWSTSWSISTSNSSTLVWMEFISSRSSSSWCIMCAQLRWTIWCCAKSWACGRQAWRSGIMWAVWRSGFAKRIW